MRPGPHGGWWAGRGGQGRKPTQGKEKAVGLTRVVRTVAAEAGRGEPWRASWRRGPFQSFFCSLTKAMSAVSPQALCRVWDVRTAYPSLRDGIKSRPEEQTETRPSAGRGRRALGTREPDAGLVCGVQGRLPKARGVWAGKRTLRAQRRGRGLGWDPEWPWMRPDRGDDAGGLPWAPAAPKHADLSPSRPRPPSGPTPRVRKHRCPWCGPSREAQSRPDESTDAPAGAKGRQPGARGQREGPRPGPEETPDGEEQGKDSRVRGYHDTGSKRVGLPSGVPRRSQANQPRVRGAPRPRATRRAEGQAWTGFRETQVSGKDPGVPAWITRRSREPRGPPGVCSPDP